MNIRKMTIEDYDEVYALWTTCKGMGLNDIDDSYAGILRFLDRNDTCFVAETDAKIVGVIMAGNDGRRGYIYHTVVMEEYQGKGIGTKLVNTVLTALQGKGISKVALVVFANNDAGNAFWEKLGFGKREDIVYRNKALAEMKRYDT